MDHFLSPGPPPSTPPPPPAPPAPPATKPSPPAPLPPIELQVAHWKPGEPLFFDGWMFIWDLLWFQHGFIWFIRDDIGTRRSYSRLYCGFAWFHMAYGFIMFLYGFIYGFAMVLYGLAGMIMGKSCSKPVLVDDQCVISQGFHHEHMGHLVDIHQ